MRRRGRVLRVAKWVATVACGLCVAAFVISLWCNVGVEMARPAAYAWVAYVGGGCIYYGFGATRVRFARASRVELQITGHRYDDVFVEKPQGPVRWTPTFKPYRGTTAGFVRMPLWTILLTLLVPTTFLWRRDRHRRLPGHCRQCGYNLTGNVSGRCPECGRHWRGS